ncbi:MBL fold metallo-hydrolase [Aureivirga sp. CE67]|uniref:MBL fold metallo-hydrolase n=1 Tax=Aureivirga sp. CE67 TaxID=1788983 RepID=UPI0018CBA1BC|nr:MBL fold metallo-hydrolase [Aureivirga sp. CE67]
MKQIFPDIWQGGNGRQFGTLSIKAYFLRTPEGNILFYNTKLEDDFKEIEKLGGIDFQFLSHCHEVDESLSENKKRFSLKLAGHPNLKRYLSGITELDISFDSKENISTIGNVLVIPTPGHTDSSLCYYYQSSSGKNHLFLADTLYSDNGNYRTLVVKQDGGNKEELKNSLEKIKNLNVDVVYPSVAVGVESDYFEVIQKQWEALMNKLIDKL